MTQGDENDRRLTIVERDLLHMQRTLDQHMREERDVHKEISKAVGKLDERTDQIAMRTTAAFTVVAALWAIIILLAPFLRQILALPGA